MQVVGELLLLLLGLAIVVSAVRPDLPILRSGYWWTLHTHRRPSGFERIAVAALGLFLVCFGIYEATLLIH